MALVPMNKISEYFSLVEENFEAIEDEMDDGAIDYFTYFSCTYVGKPMTRSGGQRQPNFAHSTWNKYDEIINGASITTNKAESYNGAWKTRSDTSPSFWSTLDAFKREESYTAMKWHENVVNIRDQPEGPNEGPTRRILQREKEEKNRNVVMKESEVTMKTYLTMLASLVGDLD
jgi:hypothetical protein